MAGEFYKATPSQQIGVQSQAVGGPNFANAVEANNRRTKSIINGLDGLVNLGTGAANKLNKMSDEAISEAKKAGKSEAQRGVDSTAKNSFMAGDAQQEAYDDVRAEDSVKDMPDYVDQWLANKNKDIGKPLDELTRDELQGWMDKAREDFLKTRGIADKSWAGKAKDYASEMMGKQLDWFTKKAREVRDAKAQGNISSLVTKTVNAWQGNAQEIDANIAAELGRYQQSLGDASGEKTNQAVVTGLLSSVMTDVPNLNTLAYLKSDEARKRFGHIEGFSRAVEQADEFSTKAQNSVREQQKLQAENKFYGLVNGGAFDTEEEIQNELNSYPDEVVDQGDKYTWKSKAMKQIKLKSAANALQGAVSSKNFGIVNSAKHEELLAAFERNVMPASADIDAALNHQGGPKDPETAIQNNFTAWVKSGFNVPNHVRDHLNSPLNAGNSKAWDDRLVTYQKLSQRLGASGVSKLYTAETQASMDEYAAIRADTTLKPEDRKQALVNFMEGAKSDRITGLSTNATIRRELIDENEGLVPDMQSFISEGGGDTTLNFDVPADLQPFTSTRSNSDTSISGYSMKSLMGNYSIYRRQNPNESKEVALRKAKNDFLNQNVWVDWHSKSTYAPREFGSDFGKRGMDYIKRSGIVDRISITEGIPSEDVERRLTIEPASDYHSSRKMSIYFDGIEQDKQFTVEQFDKNISLLNAQERAKVLKEVSDLRNSPEYRAKQEKILRYQKSLRTFGLGLD